MWNLTNSLFALFTQITSAVFVLLLMLYSWVCLMMSLDSDVFLTGSFFLV